MPCNHYGACNDRCGRHYNKCLPGPQGPPGPRGLPGAPGDIDPNKDYTLNGDITINGQLNANGGLLIDGCIEPIGQLPGSVNEGELCFNVDCDFSYNFTKMNITRNTIALNELAAPFDNAEQIPVPSNEVCPTPGTTGTFAIGESKALDYLILTNEDDEGRNPGVVGPWYFEPEPFVANAERTVLTIGCREPFVPDFSLDETKAPTGPNSFSRIRITADQDQIETDLVEFDLNLAWSTEATYDYLYVDLNGRRIRAFEGTNRDPNDPYRKETVKIQMPKDGNVLLTYEKDPAAYGGNDTAYFYLTNVKQVNIPAFPSDLVIQRGDETIFSYASLLNLDGVNSSLSIYRELELLKGDQIKLLFDSNVYSEFGIDFILKNVDIVQRKIFPEENVAPLKTNEISFNNRSPADKSCLGGWYESDNFVTTVIFVEEQQDGILVQSYDVYTSGPYFLNNAFFNAQPRLWPKVGPNLYDSLFGGIYKFVPETGNLVLNFEEDPSLIPRIGDGTVFRRVGNPDERFWKYQHSLQDHEHIFNAPVNFFDFVWNYYKAGFPTQFSERSIPMLPGINPLGLDLTQVKRSFGSLKRREYDDLYRKLRDFGIERRYGVNRFIYWPYPGSDLTENQKAQLRWVVNQNRYPFLAFVPNQPNEQGSTYPKLLPGETVTMTGSGTRLDNFPLKLATDGYHTGPKPGPEFMQTSDHYDIFNQWGLYSLRLPIVIDDTNNQVWTQNCTLGELTTDVDDLGPFVALGSDFGPGLSVPIDGKLVLTDPLFADTELVNAADVNGNVALISRGAIDFYTKVLNAQNAGATGVVIYSNVPGFFGPAGFPPFPVEITIPSCMISQEDGAALVAALENGEVNVHIETTAEPEVVVIPPGTYYFNEIADIFFEAWNNFQTNFFIELGNYFTPAYATNNQCALAGDRATCLFGPEHPEYPSTFFGQTGMDIGRLWSEVDQPLVADVNFEYGVLGVGEYKSHTPLTSAEAQALLDNMAQITVGATHGPVCDDMPYDKLVACINELSMARSTEDHSLVAPWALKTSDGLYEIPEMNILLERLNQIDIDPGTIYASPFNQLDPNSSAFAPTLYSISIRATGLGHPGEFSEMYSSGAYRAIVAESSRGEGRLEWIVPRNKFYYPENTVVPGAGDMSGREVEIPLVNYLENPKWIIATVGSDGYPAYAAGPTTPTYNFIPLDQHNNEYSTYIGPEDEAPTDSRVVDGEWVVGTLKEEKVRQILGLDECSCDPVPVIGYISHYSSGWNSSPDGDATTLPWYDANGFTNFFGRSDTGIAGATTVLKYFNDLGVEHIVADQRNTVGGGTPFWASLANLIGGDREFSSDSVTRIMPLDGNSVTSVVNGTNVGQLRVDSGFSTPTVVLNPLDCKPSQFQAVEGFDAENGVWNGEKTGKQANVIWLTNATTISATQLDFTRFKGTSLNKNTFDGDLGKNTRVIAYGVYYRPFSTGGNYTSYINWWNRGRAGEEEIRNGLMMGLDRYEVSRSAYLDNNQSVLKALDQDFSNYHRPHIKWDMNADVFFHDIGFTKDSPSVNPATDGEPWLCKRYDDVDFNDALTYRDTLLERCVQIVTDPNVNDNIYVDNDYGNVYVQIDDCNNNARGISNARNVRSAAASRSTTRSATRAATRSGAATTGRIGTSRAMLEQMLSADDFEGMMKERLDLMRTGAKLKRVAPRPSGFENMLKHNQAILDSIAAGEGKYTKDDLIII